MERTHSDYPDYRDIRLTDDVVTLRSLREEDAEALLAGEDEENRKWLQGGKASTLESTRAWIKKASGLAAWYLYDHYAFAIEDNANGVLAGIIDVHAGVDVESKVQAGEANIAYSVQPEFRGKGYAPRAVNLVLSFLQTRGVEKAFIRANPENASSIRVAEKCGFAPTNRVLLTRDKEHLIEFEKIIDTDGPS